MTYDESHYPESGIITNQYPEPLYQSSLALLNRYLRHSKTGCYLGIPQALLKTQCKHLTQLLRQSRNCIIKPDACLHLNIIVKCICRDYNIII